VAKEGTWASGPKAGVSHVVGVDIAAQSIEQCKDRYFHMCKPGRNPNGIFSAEFHVVDCTKERVGDRLKDPNMKFDLVSCQFAFHYCFESLPQAECMLSNASMHLRKGGFFIGTTPDSADIMARLQASGGTSFGNSLYRVSFSDSDSDSSEDEEEGKAACRNRQPLFGAKYNFHLHEVVDCPEFLVHFPTLSKLCEKYGLMMCGKQRFEKYFEGKKDKEGARQLMERMNALESMVLPVQGEGQGVGGQGQYNHLQHANYQGRVGTLSKDEWEALTIYTVFAFKKMR